MQSKWQWALAALGLITSAQACSLLTDFPEIDALSNGGAGGATTSSSITGAGGATTGSSTGQGGATGSGGGEPTLTPSTFWVGTHRGTASFSIETGDVPTPSNLPETLPNGGDCAPACADCILSETSPNNMGCDLLRNESVAKLRMPGPDVTLNVVDGARFASTLQPPSTPPSSVVGPTQGQWGFVVDGAGRGRVLAGCGGPIDAEIFITSTTTVPANDPELLVIAGGTEATELKIAPLDENDPCGAGQTVFSVPAPPANSVPFLVALRPDLTVAWHEVLTPVAGPTTPLYFSDVTSTENGFVAALGIWNGRLRSTLSSSTSTETLDEPDPEYFAQVITPEKEVAFHRLGVSVSGTQTVTTGLSGLDASVDAVESPTSLELWFGLRGLDQSPPNGCPATRGVIRSLDVNPDSLVLTNSGVNRAFPCTGGGDDLKWVQVERLAVQRDMQDSTSELVFVAGTFAGASLSVAGNAPTLPAAVQGEAFIAAYSRSDLKMSGGGPINARWARKVGDLAPDQSQSWQRPKVAAIDAFGGAVLFAGRAPRRGSLSSHSPNPPQSNAAVKDWCFNTTMSMDNSALAIFGRLRGVDGLIDAARMAGLPQPDATSASRATALVARNGAADFAILTNGEVSFECGANPDASGSSQYRLGTWDFQ